MPYYVYAMQTGSKFNHLSLCGTFVDYHDAEICERDQSRNDLKDKTLVKLIYAQNQTHARQRIKEIQRESRLA
jgi:hypothetical protein